MRSNTPQYRAGVFPLPFLPQMCYNSRIEQAGHGISCGGYSSFPRQRRGKLWDFTIAAAIMLNAELHTAVLRVCAASPRRAVQKAEKALLFFYAQPVRRSRRAAARRLPHADNAQPAEAAVRIAAHIRPPRSPFLPRRNAQKAGLK